MLTLGHSAAVQSFAGAAMILILAGCAPEIGGAGQLSTGEPISGTFAADATKNRSVITIASPAGWSCQGVWTEAAGRGAAKTFPMTCADGAKGTIILTMNNITQQMTGSFQLDNGKAGQVEFGFKPT